MGPALIRHLHWTLALALLLALAACSGPPSYVPCPSGVITITNQQADCPAGMPE